jgi:hypothetical protein
MLLQSKKPELIESIPRGLSASTVLVLDPNTESTPRSSELGTHNHGVLLAYWYFMSY